MTLSTLEVFKILFTAKANSLGFEEEAATLQSAQAKSDNDFANYTNERKNLEDNDSNQRIAEIIESQRNWIKEDLIKLQSSS